MRRCLRVDCENLSEGIGVPCGVAYPQNRPAVSSNGPEGSQHRVKALWRGENIAIQGRGCGTAKLTMVIQSNLFAQI